MGNPEALLYPYVCIRRPPLQTRGLYWQQDGLTTHRRAQAMRINDQAIDQAFNDLRKTCGGLREDYFGLLYLENEYRIPRAQAINQVTFHGNDYGVDGFHFDRERRNFYLFQFKYSESHQQFKGSFQRLIDAGMKRLFDSEDQDPQQNQLIQQIKATLLENQAIIDRVYFHFVFLGDPEAAEQSRVLADLRETLENKKYLVDNFLSRDGSPPRHITLAVEFKSARSNKVGGTSHVHKTRTYSLHVSDEMTRDGPAGETMHLAFIRVADLHAIFADLRWRFFERNIRAALPPEEAVNTALKTAFRRIVLESKEPPEVFAFNHTGVTLAAEALSRTDGLWNVTSPRLLNGAQTVATFAKFLDENKGNRLLEDRQEILNNLYVQCRIITDASDEFITTVTVNNNRQNPVEPWNLRANDRVQLELADMFLDQVKLLYARHENLLRNLSDEDIEELGVEGGKAIEIYRLGQTFAVADGEIDKLSRMREVFEDDRFYDQLFSNRRLKADARKIVLCYKAGLYAGRLVREVEAMGRNKYDFVKRGRNMLWALVCQGMLNDREVNDCAETWGHSLRMEMEFRKWLLDLAKTQCRFILSDLVEDKAYREKTAEGNYSYLKNTAAFKRAIELAYKRYKWTKRDLT